MYLSVNTSYKGIKMYKLKIMIIDDNIDKRKNIFEAFLTSNLVDTLEIGENEKRNYKKNIPIEFDLIYPIDAVSIDTFIKDTRVDAYFLDVIYEPPSEWSLLSIIQSINKHNERAPIFMYSTEWQTKAILQEVSDAFRNGFPGKTATYFYNLNDITKMTEEFRRNKTERSINKVCEERKYIKKMISQAKGITEKLPFSSEKNVAILHISDIQYGDQNRTYYTLNLWKEVAKICSDLKEKGEIAGIDLVALTGDISMHGYVREMEEARKDLNVLFKELWPKEYEEGVYKERILLVPGNHDFDLNFCTLNYLITENCKGKREIDFQKAAESLKDENRRIMNDYSKMGLSAYRDFAYNLTHNSIFYESTGVNFIEQKYKSWNLRFICLNTCGEISSQKTNGVGIEKLELENIVNDNNWREGYTIVLSHHTPLYKSEREEEKKNFMANCYALVHTCNAKVWLGGHHHVEAEEDVKTSYDTCKVYECATTRLEEDWAKESKYEVIAKDGSKIKSCRGFQILLLRWKDGNYEPEIFKYRFDDKGVAHEI